MKTWDKPKLIVLVRNDPQEAVLSGCKGYIPGGLIAAIEPMSTFESCMQMLTATPPIACQSCYDVSTS